MSITNQAYIFIMTVIIGFIVGFVYDLFRIFRRTIKHNNIFIQIEDTIYWIMISVLFFYILLSKNYGEVRAFSIVGAFIGMLIYFLTLSQIILPITVKIINLIKKIILFVIKIISIPIRFVLKLLMYPYGFICKYLKVCYNKSNRIKSKSKNKAIKVLRKIKRQMKIAIFKK